MSSIQIDIIPAQEVDKIKWDTCVNSNLGGLIYATSVYLDHMCDNWHAIIVNDYESVMPVPWRKKAGIRYAYQVPFIQQLGIIGSAGAENAMLQHLYKFVKYGDYIFNFNNHILLSALPLHASTNYVLDLSDKPFLKDHVSTGFMQSLKKPLASNYVFGAIPAETAIDIFRENYIAVASAISNEQWKCFMNLTQCLVQQGQAFAWQVTGNDNAPFAVALVLQYGGRVYNILNAVTPAGRANGANYLLYYQLLSQYARKPFLFDFEGSDLPGVKAFYQKFGPVNQPYYSYHFNNLPFPLKQLKR